MQEEEKVEVSRDGQVIGSFSYMGLIYKSASGELRPSDYAYIVLQGGWVFLYKALAEVVDQEFFEELKQDEYDGLVQEENAKAASVLELYEKALLTEKEPKKQQEFILRIQEFKELQKHLGGMKKRFRKRKEKEDYEEEDEEGKKNIRRERHESKRRTKELLKALKTMIKGAKKSGEDVDSYFDWYEAFKFELAEFDPQIDAKTAESYFKAFKKLECDEEEIESLVEEIGEAMPWVDDPNEYEIKMSQKNVTKIFRVFLKDKGALEAAF